MMQFKTITKWIPVMIGPEDYVMSDATILQESRPDHEEVTITIKANGPRARLLGDFVSANEVVALSFQGAPVKTHTKEQ